jgi:Starch-binding module 26/Chitobiase/beta-hexosaminidase C-terminal domain
VDIAPTSGNYTAPVNVSITAKGGEGALTIRYTTDGTDPSVSSPIYTRSLTFASKTTVKARAFDENGHVSAMQGQVHTFVPQNNSVTQSPTCNIPPTVTAAPNAGNYPTYPINITLTASNFNTPVAMYYTTDGSTPTTNSTRYNTAFSLGTDGVAKTVKVLAVDNIAQTSITAFDYTFNPAPDIWVYFKRPTNWGTNIKIHHWNSVPTGVYTPTTWPGVAMTPVCGDWYSFKFVGISATNLIFNDGAGNQTGDLSRTVTGYYDNGWLTTTPTITGTPSVSASPLGSTSGSAIAVTLTGVSCSGNATIYYTTDGSTPTTASSSGINTVNLNITQTTTVKFFVTDGTGATSAIQTQVYTITSLQNITIYCKKPTTWGTTVKLHYFNVSPNTNYPNTTWPGVTMTDDGGGWYKFTFNQIASTNFVINNNASPQTADLFRNTTGWYDLSVTPAVWYNTDPRIIPVELVDFKGIFNKNKRQVELNWQTASESNNVGFNIERSVNGFNFNNIGFVKGNGTTGTPQYYGFNDANFADNTINYYRLRQIDTDNKATLSKTIAIATDAVKSLKVYPTLVVNGFLNVLSSENSGNTEGSSFAIYNLMGQALMHGKIANPIDVSALPQGVFILKIGTQQAKFIKQ